MAVDAIAYSPYNNKYAAVVELAYTADLKSAGETLGVRVPPAAPTRRKRHIACDEFFYFIAKLIVRSLCCSSFPKRTRCAGLRFGGGNGFSKKPIYRITACRSKLSVACSDFFWKSEHTHAAAPPFPQKVMRCAAAPLPVPRRCKHAQRFAVAAAKCRHCHWPNDNWSKRTPNCRLLHF